MYLIIQCEELGDQWECDANRTPICLTEDASKYGAGYEVYEVLPNNTFSLVKSYEESLEEGVAVYFWNEGEEETTVPKVCEKLGKSRNDITKSKVKALKSKYHFAEKVNIIYEEIQRSGAYGETMNGKWYVIGEYRDNYFSLGY